MLLFLLTIIKLMLEWIQRGDSLLIDCPSTFISVTNQQSKSNKNFLQSVEKKKNYTQLKPTSLAHGKAPDT